MAYDKNGIILADGANDELVGEASDVTTQEAIKSDSTLNNLTKACCQVMLAMEYMITERARL